MCSRFLSDLVKPEAGRKKNTRMEAQEFGRVVSRVIYGMRLLCRENYVFFKGRDWFGSVRLFE